METTDTDILVIGAGIAGAGVAADLARDHRVVIVDQEDRPGYHSTGRSAAMFIQNYGPAPIRRLSQVSEPLFERPDPKVFSGPLLRPRGMLTIARQSDVEAIHTFVDAGEGVHLLSPADAIAMVPILRHNALAAACFEPNARDIDVAALHYGWLKAAKAHGATLVTRVRVVAGERSCAGWKIETSAGRFRARVVVDAAGAWADQVARVFGVAPLGLQPKRRSIAVLPAPEGHDVRDWPLIGDVMESWYAKPDSGRLLVSPADAVPVDPHDADVDELILAEGLDRFAQAVTMPINRVERSWAGLRTFASDGVPVAGFDPSVAGFFWLAGQGGYGVQTAPALSMLAAELIRQHALPISVADIGSALDPVRFSDPVK